jgi:16S rRNA pseudouridine516 synthase
MGSKTKRLDKYVSDATGLSRSQARRVIVDGEVWVDGAVADDPSRHVSAISHITYSGQTLAATTTRYIMLNKPLGYVCATRDGLHRTVLDLLDVTNTEGLHIAGRLDIDTTGLVLITDDGNWSHRITSPKREIEKAYRAVLTEPLTDQGQRMLEAGIQLEGEERRCQPARIERLAEREVRIVVTEGKYHQVKRMLVAVGNHVETLHRERIGNLVLDPALAPGASRNLTADEIAGF